MISAPCSHFLIKSGMSLGGCWPSASIVIAASPLAYRRPAERAGSLPKLRDNERTLIFGFFWASFWIIFKVLSVEPSLTIINSYLKLSFSSTGRSELFMKSLMPSASLWTGMMTDSVLF